MKKRWMALVLAGLMLCALVGCNNTPLDGGEDVPTTNTTSTDSKVEESTVSTTDAPTTQKSSTSVTTQAAQPTTQLTTQATVVPTTTMATTTTAPAPTTTTTATTTTTTTTASTTTTTAPTVGVWSGSTAYSFAGGDGSAGNPYRIETGEQLAYLANQVNMRGKTFSGQYVVLSNDIDLNSYPWTPIGTSQFTAFKGTFDGAGHTISNLSITAPCTYTTDSDSEIAVAGLFGACENATLRNLSLEGVKIDFSYLNDYMYVGALVGRCYGDAYAEISNVSATKVTVTVKYNKSGYYYGCNSFIGGIVGTVHIKNGGWCELNSLEVTNCTINSKSNGGWSGMGGIGGAISNEGTVTVQNFACYAKMIHSNQSGNNVSAAFAYVYNGSGSVRIEKGFSAITVSGSATLVKGQLQNGDTYSERASAIVGTTPWQSSYKGGFQLANVYGYVSPRYGSDSTVFRLHDISSGYSVTERNSQGCTALPSGHGLDPQIWDLQSLSAPVLK